MRMHEQRVKSQKKKSREYDEIDEEYDRGKLRNISEDASKNAGETDENALEINRRKRVSKKTKE